MVPVVRGRVAEFLPDGQQFSFYCLIFDRTVINSIDMANQSNSIPSTNVPVLNSGDLVVFPESTLTLLVHKSQNLKAVEAASKGDGWIVAVANRIDGVSEADIEHSCRVGVIGRIEAKPRGDGVFRVIFHGQERFQISEFGQADGYAVASGGLLIQREDADADTLRSLKDGLQKVALEILGLLSTDTGRLVEEIRKIDDPSKISFVAAQYLGLSRSEGQELLETASLKNRLLKTLQLLASRKENLEVEAKIRETLSENIGKKQREGLLREQLKAIQEELGEGGDGPSADDYRQRVTKSGMPEEVGKVALREVSRLERMGDQSAESHVIRNYLDLLCEMPWNVSGTDAIDLHRAKEVLNRDHYGLDKIKRRILEHLSVMKLMPEKRGSILLFLGPPGVGKTSLGRSIAEAIGREFVRVSLGGVRDDADIRGHRRTYVGALPGRIIDGIRRAKAKDPVFVLDEIDKLARGWGGDPSSALLEVLDPEQNSTFHDHYLDVPFDLSQVLFICTANTKEGIPGPLLDRMEVIELSGYTTQEKLHIGKNHLFPAELKAHGVSRQQAMLADGALTSIIEGYTREAGVRSLRRELTKIARFGAAQIASNSAATVQITEDSLHEILGAKRFESEEFVDDKVPGVVTGMAWTPVGGDVLFVEAAMVPGEGKVAVTGQLGDVMKESSQIAVALARIRLESVASAVLFKDRDIHLHVPGGAIPKDGPSAGVTMFTAVASMMLNLPVNSKIAMTGEVTLRGKILPVGGIKEKVLAAARYGVQQIILPKRNARDLEEIPQEIRSELSFHLVSDVGDVLRVVFGELCSRPAIAGDEYGKTLIAGSPVHEQHLHSAHLAR